jgi:hypothetical protein
MSGKHLRRKGQGETQRPICPYCQQDLKRSYVRGWSGDKGTYIATGWECPDCKFKQWD